MKKLLTYFGALAALALMFTACAEEEYAVAGDVPQEVIQKVAQLGFSTDGILAIEEGYLVERDIVLTHTYLASTPTTHRVPNAEQYSTDNLVSSNGNRVITIYAPTSGRNSYSSGMIAGLDLAIARYNNENLSISFQRVSSSSNADIVMTRLRKGEERQGILGSAGFPTASGDPYGEIKMSGILESSYGLSTGGIATIIGHEMGHCIGFRHTDFFDRSISCGGGTSNEGTAGIGANHIPGTPTGATLAGQSWMLSCTDGGDRPFNNDDVTALNYLY